MNYLDVVIDKIINNFDFAYMFIVNVLTYIIIKKKQGIGIVRI